MSDKPNLTGHNAPSRPANLPASRSASSYSAELSERRQELSKLEAASLDAEAILRAYPQADARASLAFGADLSKYLATLSEEERGWVMDIRRGIRARCKFLPTMADIETLISETRAAKEQFMDRGGSGYQRFEPSPWTEEDRRVYGQRQRYRPFPKLYDMIEADGTPELLHRTFDTLFSASRALAIHGPDAARQVLRTTQTGVQPKGTLPSIPRGK